MAETSQQRESNASCAPHGTTTTLAGPFLVQCTDNGVACSFTLVPIDEVRDIDPSFQQSEGARAWAALHSDNPLPLNQQSAIELTAQMDEEAKERSIRVSSSLAASNKNSAQELCSLLSCVLVQWIMQRHQSNSSKIITVRFPGETIDKHFDLSTFGDDDESIHKLFQVGLSSGATSSGNSAAARSEIVEMVDRNGHALGRVPRHLVHRHNLLHRGIGMFVTANKPISTSSRSSSLLQQQHEEQQPDLYVHRRTDTKKIFPSLYDMFVGGVSLAGEEGSVTALREVAEELGLNANRQDQLSQPLLSCVVCTAYNRCYVVLYSYTMNVEKETIVWQEEEVAWGSFVPYAVIEAAADLSIQRLAATRSWPGRVPPIQSTRNGKTTLESKYNWTDWDFVPDGLLVWEAWLRWLDEQ